MTNREIFNKDSTFISHTYNRFPIAVQSGHSSTAKDFDGNEYIDFGSGIGVNSFGLLQRKVGERSDEAAESGAAYVQSVLHCA